MKTNNWKKEYLKLLNQGCNDDFYIAYVEDLLNNTILKLLTKLIESTDDLENKSDIEQAKWLLENLNE